MRFLILTQYYPPEVAAPQVRLAALVRELGRRGHEVDVVTTMPSHPLGRVFDGYRGKVLMTERLDGARVRRVWSYPATGAGLKRMVNYGSFTLASVVGLARSRRPDVVFVESPPLFLSVPAWLFCTVWRRPMIFNVADLWPDSARELGLLGDGLLLKVLLGLERWTYRRARWVNAVTDGVWRRLEHDKRVPTTKLVSLPNGVDVDMFAARPPDADVRRRYGVGDGPLFVYAGTIGYAHGVDVALDAMTQLRASHPDAHLLLLGGGSERVRLEARARDEGLTNVTFADPVPPAELARVYNAAAAGLSTLRDLPLFEGTRPSKVFAVMASGLPVVYSGAGEGERLVRDAGAGPTVPPEDAEALAGALAQVIVQPAEAAAMGRRGRELVERRFSWQSIVGDWLAQIGVG